MAKKATEKVEKRVRRRSPNYPAISLPDAVSRVRKLYEEDGKAGAPLEVAVRRFGYKTMNGASMTVMSALKKYGLIDYQGKRAVPTQLAVDILQFPEGHPRKRQALREAALSPVMNRTVFEQYSTHGNLPGDDSLRPELIADKDFSPKAANAYIKDLKETLIYAGLMNESRVFLAADQGVPPAEVSPPENGPAEMGQRQPELSSSSRLVPLQGVAVASAAMRGSGTVMRELAIPLIGGETALLRVPVPLSEENYEYLLEQIKVFRRGIVSSPSHEPLPRPASPDEPPRHPSS